LTPRIDDSWQQQSASPATHYFASAILHSCGCVE
jgi:hypothetical protein